MAIIMRGKDVRTTTRVGLRERRKMRAKF